MTTLIEIASSIPGIKVAAWKARHYVNLPMSSTGDRNTKIWIEGNVLTVQDGKGYRSDDFNAAMRALVEAVEAAGAVRKGYSTSINATYTLG